MFFTNCTLMAVEAHAPTAECMPRLAQPLTDEAWQRVFEFLVTHRAFVTCGPRIAQVATCGPIIIPLWQQPGAANSSAWQRIVYTHKWNPRWHYRLHVPGAEPDTAATPFRNGHCRRGPGNCLCCRAHNREDWPSGCNHCIEAWVLSCVAKSWSAMLKQLAATWAL